MTKAKHRRALLLAGSALALMPAPAAAQTGTAATDRTQQLEQRVRELEAALADIRAQMAADRATGQAATGAAPAPATAPSAVAGAPSGPVTAGNAPGQDQRGKADAQAMVDRVDRLEKATGFRVGASTIRIGGYFKFDALSTKYGGGDPPPQGIIRFYYSPGAIPIGGIEEGAQLTYNGRETRFSINTETPIGKKKLTGTLELDFLDTPLGNDRVANNYVPRIRQGFLTYDKLTLGQTWSTFQNVATLPERVDFIGPTEGTVFIRQPIIRYTDGPLQLALEQPETTVQFGSASVEADDDQLPDLVARYNFTGSWGSAAIAAIGRQLNFDSASNPGLQVGPNVPAFVVEDSAFGYGLSLSGVIKVGTRDNFNFMITGGEGIGRYVGLNLRDDVVITRTGELDPVGILAGFASFRHFWSERTRSVLTGSFFRADNPAIAGLGVTERVGSVSFDTFYSPEKQITFGLGYRYGRRELESGASGDLNRLQFSAQYNF